MARRTTSASSWLAKAITKKNPQSLIAIGGTGGADILIGTDADEFITGLNGNDLIYGAGGADQIEGGNDNDTAYGGIGNDDVRGGFGDDTLYGDDGDDLVLGEGGSDTLFGGAGSDILDGASGDSASDTVYGDDGNDQITGGEGSDFLFGGVGLDTLNGNGGNDTLHGGSEADRIDGGAGTDFASFAGAAGGVIVNLGFAGGSGSGSGGEANGDTYFSIEGLIGSASADILIGATGGSDTIYGAGGNDVLSGQGGDIADTLYGGDGDDTLSGNGGADALHGDNGIDFASYAAASASVTVNLGNPGANGGEAVGDTYTNIEGLIGSDSADFLVGRALASDTIYGGAGDDLLSGNGQVAAAPGGFDPNGDTLFGGAGFDQVRYNGGSAAVTINLATGVGSGGNAEGDRFNSIEHVVGSLYNDTLIGSAGTDTLDGHDSNDTLEGGAGADSLIGGAGVDTVSFASATAGVAIENGLGTAGEAAGDVLNSIEVYIGSNHNDTLTGLSGVSETFYGGLGNDALNGNGFVAGTDAVGDVLYGGAGLDSTGYWNSNSVTVDLTQGRGWGSNAENDYYYSIEYVIGSQSTDTLIGSAAAETLDGFDGNDTLQGGAGADSLIGGAGTDTVSWANSATAVTFMQTTGSSGDANGDVLSGIEVYIGSNGDDWITGNPGVAETFYGGAGNDFLNGNGLGGAGDPSGDVYYGGAGIDGTAYNAGSTSITIDLTLGRGWGSNAENDYYYSIESVVGSLSTDTLIGSATADTLDGFDSNDTLIGNAGDDSLIGGNGNDTLIGGAGGDRMSGGAGTDTVSWAGAPGGITYDLGGTSSGDAAGDVIDSVEVYIGTAADDRILTAGGIAETLYGGDGNDFLSGGGQPGVPGAGGSDASGDTYFGGNGIDAVKYNGGSASVTLDLTLGRGFGGNAQNDYFFSIEHAIGSFENDTLLGSAGGDTLDGDLGADTLLGLGGDDRILGNDGNDIIFGGAGADRIDGGAGSDTVSYALAGASVTVFLGGAPGVGDQAAGDVISTVENLIGSGHADVLWGEAGANAIFGGLGADVLTGLGGDDLLYGGADDDVLFGDAGADSIYGGTGVDHMSYFNGPAGPVTVSLATGVGSGDIAEGDRLFEIENLTGTNFGDRLEGSFGDNLIVGAAGADLLSGLGGNDTLYGGSENDVLFGDGGADTLYGGTDNDTASYFNGAAMGVTVSLLTGMGFNDIAEGDRLYEIENLTGTNFSDTLTGSAGANLINGAGSNDTILGLGGDDTLLGGDGDDRLDDILGSDSIFGGNGNDTVQYSGSSYLLSGGLGMDTLLGTVGADSIDLAAARFSGAGGGSGATAASVAGFFDVMDLGDGDDLLWYSTPASSNLSLTVFGGLGNDRISMLDGDAAIGSSHTLYGGAGSDTIWAGWYGMGGNATIFGGDGDDFIYAGAGGVGPGGYDDTLYGGAGKDIYYWTPNGGGFGQDIVYDSSGANAIVLFGGNVAPAAGFPDIGAVDNDPVNGKVNLVDLGGGWWKIESKDDPSQSITFRGGDIATINLHHRPGGAGTGENFIYTWDAINSVWIDQNG